MERKKDRQKQRGSVLSLYRATERVLGYISLYWHVYCKFDTNYSFRVLMHT